MRRMEKILLDLGCGNLKYQSEEYKVIGLDLSEGEEVDVTHDLTEEKLPFKDKYFDVVRASHILEHIEHNEH
ncbi:MAG: methyltransferase domain-containing protein, partial [Candidatus Aenigmarchaeota archaeon]|nr:methyltransferase domain-containing protein [Candidatus Aenigmarchaeota archaeon]